MLKVGGIYNDHIIDGYFVLLEETSKSIFRIDVFESSENGINKNTIIDKLKQNINDSDMLKVNFWYDNRPFITNGDDGYLGQVPEEILNTYLSPLHETSMYKREK